MWQVGKLREGVIDEMRALQGSQRAHTVGGVRLPAAPAPPAS